jgi:outer membrane lipoprotein carrier protein
MDGVRRFQADARTAATIDNERQQKSIRSQRDRIQSRRMRPISLFLALLTGCALAQPASQPALKNITQAIDRHYNSLQTLKADFSEIYSANGQQRSESGTLLLKKPGKMRWDYKQPREKLFLSDGKTAWFYVPGEQQARKAPVSSLDDLRSPLRYLLGKTKLQKEFDALAFAPDVQPLTTGDVVLRGIPRDMADRVEHVIIEASPAGDIRRFVIFSLDGSTTEFRFTNLTENTSIADSLFRFSPPPGVETIQATELATQQ